MFICKTIFKTREIVNDTGAEDQKKKILKTLASNFGFSLLKILENHQTIPEYPEKSFLFSSLFS